MCALGSGRKPLSSAARRNTRPPSDATTPLIRLISVLFPAPFGPMSPLIWPRPIAKEAPSMAQTPPKLRVTFSTRSNVAWSAYFTAIDGASGAAGKSTFIRRGKRRLNKSSSAPAPPRGKAKMTTQKKLPSVQPAKDIGQLSDHCRADQAAPQRSFAAEEQHQENIEQRSQRETVRVHGAVVDREKRAGEGCIAGADHEYGRFHPVDIDAEAGSSHGIAANCAQRAANPRS